MAVRKIKKRKNRKAKEPLTWRVKGVVLRTARTLGIILMGVVLFYLGTVVYEEFHTAPYLEVKAITVEGTERVYDQEIIELSGIVMGSNIFSFDLDEARVRVMSHPFVKEAEVKRRLPDAVKLVVSEREPEAFVMVDGLYVMDTTGELFKAYSPEDALDLPVITSAVEFTEDGQLRPEFRQGIAELMGVLRVHYKPGLDDISEIHVNAAYGFTIYTLTEGVRIDMGKGGFTRKLANLEKVLRTRSGSLSLIEAIDLTGERGVVVRFTPGRLKKSV